MPGTVFVTVGTTKFDALIQAVDTIEIADALVKQGCTALVIQKGAGRYQVQTLVPLGRQHHQHSNGLQVQVFEFAPSLADYMKQADLIISHAGSGSIFEALRLGKPLVAVPNAILMDNHQAELAEHLAYLKHIIAARPDTLVHTLQHLSIDDLKPYESGDAKGIISHIDTLVAKKPSSKVPFIAIACLIAALFVAMLYASVRVLIPGRSEKYSSNV
ncbi:TPA: hypothetical protein ACH3X2_000532 [Trebouxia sp. C0005]|nr:MAG: hypothetical protein FRX49_12675 [Trebouxia sp. A1-2]